MVLGLASSTRVYQVDSKRSTLDIVPCTTAKTQTFRCLDPLGRAFRCSTQPIARSLSRLGDRLGMDLRTFV